jgi:putative selenate reductase molybdopterin-binding subunit
MKINLTLDGTRRSADVPPGLNAVKFLKSLGVDSVRNSDDGHGFAGSDTILLDGKIVGANLLMAAQLDGRDVKTVASLRQGRTLSVVQQALVEAGCVQSGYNAPAAALMMTDLIERIPAPSRADVQDALSGLFNRATGYEQFFEAVRLAVARTHGTDYAMPPAPKFGGEARYVGKRSPKVDAARLVAGEKAFVEDRIENGACILKVLRSPYAHANIKKIDTSAAEAMPGVVAVFTHANVPRRPYSQAGQGFPEPSPYDRVLLDTKVRHFGDRVAAVLAEDEDTAIAALKLIDVDYEVLPHVMDWDGAKAEDAPLIHNGPIEYVDGAPDDLEELNAGTDQNETPVVYQFPIGGNPRKNIAAYVDGGIGDVEKGFAQADVILDKTYETTQIQCTPLEMHTTYVRPEGDRIVIHASTQVPYHLRRIVAGQLGIPENKVRVIKERVGGGYGSKQDILLDELAAWAAWTTARPVFHQYTREEEFVSCSTRKPMRIRVQLGAKKDGTFTAMRMDVESNQGAYGAHALTVPMNGVSKSLPLFLCDNAFFTVTSYYSNIPPTGAYQGYGAPKANYALQVAVKELAVELGMDHYDLVEKNRVRDGVMLEILKCLGEGREGAAAPVDSCGLDEALEKGARLIEWGKAVKSEDPNVKIGKGMCILQQGSGLPGLDQANCTVKMLGDGTFLVQSGGADLGTGLDTVSAKMVAEVLRADIAKVTVQSGDTDMAPFDTGAYASSGTYFSGGAARNAAEKLKEQILLEAAAILNTVPEKLSIEYPGIIVGGKETLDFAKLAWHTQGGEGTGQLVASSSFTTEKFSFPYGAHFAQVAVNVRTGKVKVQKYYALQDCGTPINPELAKGQVFGGVLKSIGHALYEELLFDEEGRCLNPDLRSYGVPMIGDVPDDFRVELVETDDPHGPFGAKSIAEISVNGAAPTLANAIHDACGVWLRRWPFSPENVLRALGEIT